LVATIAMDLPDKLRMFLSILVPGSTDEDSSELPLRANVKKIPAVAPPVR
jgi:hypothetical protein